MKAEDLHWVAGLLEGEGSFGCYKASTKFPYVKVSMSSVDLDVVEKLHRVTGVGFVNGPYNNTTPSAGGRARQPLYRWNLQARQDALEFLRLVYPLMGQRRQGQIQEVFDKINEYEELRCTRP